MHVPVFIDRTLNTINPTKTEGFLYGIIIRKVRFPSVFFQEDKPHLSLPGVVLIQPDSPLPTVSRCISHHTFCIPSLTMINILSIKKVNKGLNTLNESKSPAYLSFVLLLICVICVICVICGKTPFTQSHDSPHPAIAFGSYENAREPVLRH